MPDLTRTISCTGIGVRQTCHTHGNAMLALASRARTLVLVILFLSIKMYLLFTVSDLCQYLNHPFSPSTCIISYALFYLKGAKERMQHKKNLINLHNVKLTNGHPFSTKIGNTNT